MKCQGLESTPDGHSVACSRDADYAHRMTSWADGGLRILTCAEHRLPPGTYVAAYYVGVGSTTGKVVPIEAARARRARARAQ